jgi:hypothetical protein
MGFGGGAQARVPKKRESDGCRDDENERSPYFTGSTRRVWRQCVKQAWSRPTDAASFSAAAATK